MRPLALALLLACGHPAAHDTMPPQPTSSAATDPTCPLEIPGTSVAVEDTAGGGALVFATTGDAAQVQARATSFAAEHGKPDAPAFAAMVAPSAKVTVAKIDGGAKLVFEAAGPDAVAALQSELRMHAGALSSGSCKMGM
jgi:hypothetical protein